MASRIDNEADEHGNRCHEMDPSSQWEYSTISFWSVYPKIMEPIIAKSNIFDNIKALY